MFTIKELKEAGFKTTDEVNYNKEFTQGVMLYVDMANPDLMQMELRVGDTDNFVHREMHGIKTMEDVYKLYNMMNESEPTLYPNYLLDFGFMKSTANNVYVLRRVAGGTTVDVRATVIGNELTYRLELTEEGKEKVGLVLPREVEPVEVVKLMNLLTWRKNLDKVDNE